MRLSFVAASFASSHMQYRRRVRFVSSIVVVTSLSAAQCCGVPGGSSSFRFDSFSFGRRRRCGSSSIGSRRMRVTPLISFTSAFRSAAQIMTQRSVPAVHVASRSRRISRSVGGAIALGFRSDCAMDVTRRCARTGLAVAVCGLIARSRRAGTTREADVWFRTLPSSLQTPRVQPYHSRFLFKSHCTDVVLTSL